ncbi:MAG: radical SAM protein [Candidatus Aminicenantes bacterium]|nr:radical SAM protein [Candidatus Aminicenantes bacterium]
MKALMINPNRFKPHVAPVGLEYVCNSLVREKIEFDLVDFNFEPESAVYRKLRQKDVDLVGITVRNLDSGYLSKIELFQPSIKKLVERIKNTCDCKVVLGGAGFSSMPREILAYSGADFGVVGYGEEALPQIVRALRQGGDLNKIDNLTWRKNGKIQVNPLSTGNYENIPVRRRNIVRNSSYYRVYGIGSIEAMRGCPRRCGYCCEPNISGSKVVKHKVGNIIEELKELKSIGIHHVFLCDSETNFGGQEYLFDFCEQLIRSRVGITWTASMYPDPETVSHKLLCLMKEAGCSEVYIGADSGSDEILTGMGRSHSAEDTTVMVEKLRKANLRPLPAYLIGWPGESIKTIEETFAHIKSCRFDDVLLFAGIRIYADTELARIAMKEGIIQENADLLEPTFYQPERVLREFIPFIRRNVRGLAKSVVYPKRGVDFENLLMRNVYLFGGFTGRGLTGFGDRMNSMSPGERMKILGKTFLDRLLPARCRYIPTA